jgi:hypothetical protein
MLEFDNIQEVENNTPNPKNVKYIKLGNITFEVVSEYVGKASLLDITKAAIRRDIESGNY